MSILKLAVIILVTTNAVFSIAPAFFFPKKLDNTDRVRKCVQCVAGNFLDKQWLLKNESAGQIMKWKPEEWNATDCHIGNARTVDCIYGCITIKIEKYYRDQYHFEGILHDCSRNLIEKSNDIKDFSDPYNYFKNANHTATVVRSGHRITYQVSSESSPTPEVIAAEFYKHNIPTIVNKVEIGLAQVGIGLIILSMVILLAVICCKPCRRETYDFDYDLDGDRYTVKFSESRKILYTCEL